MGIEDRLTAKIGPLPVWVWVALGTAAAVAFAAWRAMRQQASAVPYDPDDPSGVLLQTGAPDDAAPAAAPFETGYGDNPSVAGATSVSPRTPIQTNAQWTKIATDYLVSQGTDPVLIANALTKYTTRGGVNEFTGAVQTRPSLSFAEQAVVALALVRFGSPPEGIDPVIQVGTPALVTPPASGVKPAGPTFAPTPLPQPQPAPVSKPRVHVVVAGDKLWTIAAKYYQNPFHWTRIYARNQAVIEAAARSRGYRNSRGGWWIFPGTKLVIA